MKPDSKELGAFPRQRIVVPVDLSEISVKAVKEGNRLESEPEMTPGSAGTSGGKTCKTSIDDAKRAAHAREQLSTRLIDEGLGKARTHPRDKRAE